jgi:hypothetical protein
VAGERAERAAMACAVEDFSTAEMRIAAIAD